MELVAHGTDAAASDGLPTPVAECSPPLMVMELTVRTSVQFKEGAGRKTAEAVLWDRAKGKKKECRCQEGERQQSKTCSLEIPASYLTSGGKNITHLQKT